MTSPQPGDERARIEQSNEVAGIVFDEIKRVWPDLHPVLGLRYGIADALWAKGFRRSVVSTPSDVRELIEYARRRWREHQRMPGYAGVFDEVPDPELIRRLTDALEASAVSAPTRVAPITADAREGGKRAGR